MIKPIYFPHTYISPAAAAAIRPVFAAVVGYQPVAGRPTQAMRALGEGGFLEVVAPAAVGEERLDRILQELARWGRLQQGGAGLLSVFLSNQPGSDPLTADGTATQIASEVRRRPADAPPAGVPEALMRSVVFLQLAHQADEQSCQIGTELRRCERAHAELLGAIAGKGAGPSQAPAPDPADLDLPEADLLLAHRIRAWARLFLQRPYASPVFVTASPEVIGLLVEKFPSLRRVGRSALDRMACEPPTPAPPAAEDLMARLEMLARLPLPEAACSDEGAADGLAIYGVADVPPLRLFARLAENADPPETAADGPKWRHTVIVRIARRSVPAGRTDAITGLVIS